MRESFVIGLDHVQLAMPRGEEARAEAFYCGVLGFEMLPKPSHLAARGGCWFRSGSVQVHLGVESDFTPARKAHPGFLVRSLAVLQQQFETAGIDVVWDTQISGFQRFYAADPFGNRLEFMERIDV
jgi:catechol 2,3-dioxygenase-like lactoylglutathione lyase family enzyme